ncbi:DUF4277 domain-containing protein [Streptomyces sp. NPDC024089]|uniref:DUF4277 domain-containing protein n=1 Tax=Streptomyces sp. NPDC024089 TaxID=3154328 RepID=UPI0033F8912C
MVEKRLGALPVVSEFTRRLDLSGIVDEVCPGGASALVTHGPVIDALVANRLTAPAPLVRVGDWARTWAVEQVFVRDELDSERTPSQRTPSHWPDYVIVDGASPSAARSAGGRATADGVTAGGARDSRPRLFRLPRPRGPVVSTGHYSAPHGSRPR